MDMDCRCFQTEPVSLSRGRIVAFGSLLADRLTGRHIGRLDCRSI